MKTLIIILSLFCIVLFSASAFAQFDIGDKIKKKVGRKIDKEVDKTIDKGIDETEKVIKGENEDGEVDPDKNKEKNKTPDGNKPVGYDDNKTASLDDKPSPVLKV